MATWKCFYCGSVNPVVATPNSRSLCPNCSAPYQEQVVLDPAEKAKTDADFRITTRILYLIGGMICLAGLLRGDGAVVALGLIPIVSCLYISYTR